MLSETGDRHGHLTGRTGLSYDDFPSNRFLLPWALTRVGFTDAGLDCSVTACRTAVVTVTKLLVTYLTARGTVASVTAVWQSLGMVTFRRLLAGFVASWRFGKLLAATRHFYNSETTGTCNTHDYRTRVTRPSMTETGTLVGFAGKCATLLLARRTTTIATFFLALVFATVAPVGALGVTLVVLVALHHLRLLATPTHLVRHLTTHSAGSQVTALRAAVRATREHAVTRLFTRWYLLRAWQANSCFATGTMSRSGAWTWSTVATVTNLLTLVAATRIRSSADLCTLPLVLSTCSKTLVAATQARLYASLRAR